MNPSEKLIKYINQLAKEIPGVLFNVLPPAIALLFIWNFFENNRPNIEFYDKFGIGGSSAFVLGGNHSTAGELAEFLGTIRRINVKACTAKMIDLNKASGAVLKDGQIKGNVSLPEVCDGPKIPLIKPHIHDNYPVDKTDMPLFPLSDIQTFITGAIMLGGFAFALYQFRKNKF